MSVQTEFWDWAANPLMPDPRSCAPICRTWTTYLLDRWGGMDLGCYAARPVTGGTRPSDHASGAAIDWRYEDPGPGRSVMLDEVLPWLIDWSRDLGVQAIHDYVGCRIWRPPGTSGRPSSPSPECGWRAQTPGSQMGQPWAQWIHVACLNTRWSDTRTVDEMLPDPNPEPDPEDDDMAKMLLIRDTNGSNWAATPELTGKFGLWPEDAAALRATGQYVDVTGLRQDTVDRIPTATNIVTSG